MSNVTWDYSSEFTYNGEKQSVHINEDTLPEGVVSITYTNNEFVDASKYTATASFVVAEGYDSVGDITLDWEIKAKDLIVSAKDIEVSQKDFSEDKFEANFAGIVDKDKEKNIFDGELKFTCTYKEGSAIGEYDIEVSGLSLKEEYSKNYNLSFKKGTLTITQGYYIVSVPETYSNYVITDKDGKTIDKFIYVAYRTDYTIYIKLDEAYNRSNYNFYVNGIKKKITNNSYTFKATENIKISIDNVTMNNYSIKIYDPSKTDVIYTTSCLHGSNVESSIYTYLNNYLSNKSSEDLKYNYTLAGLKNKSDDETANLTNIVDDVEYYIELTTNLDEYHVSNIPSQVTVKKEGSTLTSSNTLHYDDEIEITYNVTEGHSLTNFKVTGATKVDGKENTYKVTGNVTIEYSEKINTFNVTDVTTNKTGYTLTLENGNLSEKINYGTEVTIQITLDGKYSKSNVKVYVSDSQEDIKNDTNLVSLNGNKYTFNIKKDTYICVDNVTINTYTVTVYEKDTTTKLHEQTVEYGKDVTFNPTKDADNTYTYTFEKFVNANNETITLTNITTDVTAYAVFKATNIEYTLTINSEKVTVKKNGSTLTSSNTLHYDDEIEITYNVTEGHSLTNFKVTGATKVDGKENTYKVTGNVTIEYSEKINTFNVTDVTTNKTGYTLTLENGNLSEKINYGTDVTIQITLDEKYSKSNVKVYVSDSQEDIKNDKNLVSLNGNKYTFNIKKDTYICVDNVTINTYNVTVYEKDTTTKLHEQTVEYGKDVTFNPTKDADNTYTYTFEKFVNANNETITLTNITTDVTAYAVFKATYIEYTLTINSEKVTVKKEGSTLTSSNTLHYDDEIEITYSQEFGYVLNEMIITGATKVDGNTYKVVGNIEISIDETDTIPSVTDYSMLVFEKDGSVRASQVNVPTGEIEIPEMVRDTDGEVITVISIKESAFSGCSSLTSIVIPDSVTSIYDNAFYGCANLTDITLPGDNTSTASLYSVSSLSRSKSRTTSFTGLTSIGEAAFSGCSSLTSIVIPDSVTSIGLGAFEGCSALESMTLPFVGETLDGEENTHFGYIFGASGYSSNKAFVPTNLKTVVITKATSIWASAFSNCSALTSITLPKTLETIGASAFSGCSALTSIVIPDSVTSIGSYAFSNCSSLANITISENVTRIDVRTFYVCRALTSIVIPDSVTEIGDSAFYYCSSLTNVTLSNKLTSIGDSAFYYCSSLTNVTLSNKLTSIGDSAFLGCSALTSIVIPDSVTSIGSSTFSACSALKDITLPENLTSIGDSVFLGCSALTSIVIPDSVTSIGSYAFSNCRALTSITLPFVGNTLDGTTNTHFGYIFGALTYSYNSNKVPTSLKTVVITKATSIDSRAFSGCSNITSITLLENLTSIGASAFEDCSSLTNVTLSNKLTSIGDSVFYNCSALTSIVIPDSVTSIGSYAFSNCSSLANITISENVTRIGASAFSDCTALESITLPENLTNIYSFVFLSCSALTDITLPNTLERIYNGAFKGCSSLTNIVIPNSVTEIDLGAFEGCSALENMTLSYVGNYKYGTTNTHFGYIFGASIYSDNATYVPTSLKTVVITKATSIADHAFYGCSNITSITLPSNLASIKISAFNGCSALTSIVIPDSVTSIGESAFNGCSALTSIYYKGTSSDWNTDFDSVINIGNDAIVYYYSETYSAGSWHFDDNGDPVLWS